jgi:hypothetical protein
MTTTIFSNKLDNRSLASFGGFNRSVLRLVAVFIALIVAGILLFSVVHATRIGAGCVGVEVNLAGSQRGAQEIPVRNQRALIEKWNGELPRLVVGEKSGLLMPLPTDQR